MQTTRQAILDYLRRYHSGSTQDLAREIGLTVAAIRRHLAVLERDRLVVSQQLRGRVGRPTLIYELSEEGDQRYPKLYDDLANAIISEAREFLGPDAQQKLLKNVAARFARQYAHRLEHKGPAERLAETARIIADRGNVVDAEWSGDDYLIHKHTCPFWNVARENSAVCALDVDFVRQLAGADARLSTSLLRGDDACTFRIKTRARPANATS